MKLPFHMSCTQLHARLYQLADGRFQIVEPCGLASVMIGYEYVLVDEDFAQYLTALDLPGLEIIDAIIYEPWQEKEIRTHKQLLIDQQFSSDMIRNTDQPSSPDTIHQDIDLDGERFLLMDRQYVFVSGPLRELLEASRFKYLRFTEGLNEFAAAET
jgi:hypothetical protein